MMLNLDTQPKSSDVYKWSDYIELLCLISQDRLISTTDVLERLSEGAELDTLIGGANSVEAETIDETNNASEQKANDWFRNIEFRSAAFEKYSSYPFRISEDRNTLFLKENLTTEHKFYIFLLLAANLRCVPKQVAHRITQTFEHCSFLALKQCLPKSAEVHIFGTSDKDGKYRGTLWNKVNLLAQDLNERVIIEKEKLSTRNVGDGGLDLVGWVPMNDSASGQLSVFAQCACTDEWVKKQHESSYATWNSKIHLSSVPWNIIFIPFCFRDAAGNWVTPHDIHQSVLIDRLRLMFLLNGNYSALQSQPSFDDIEAIINFRESIV